jgi:hypothetical protein
MPDNNLKPKGPVRRFDVFAEYNRQKALDDGVPDDEARGYGLWVAKVVASGGGRSSAPPAPRAGGKEGTKGEGEEEEEREHSKWRSLGGKPQTDEMYDKEIINRMGRDFYEEVFRPAIEKAYKDRMSYTAIRDSIRRDWKP